MTEEDILKDRGTRSSEGSRRSPEDTADGRTDADRAEYLEGGLTDVTCPGCGVTVRAKKNSPLHTSVQWSRRAVDGCAEFAESRARGEPTALVAGCGRLLDSINRAAWLDASVTAGP